MNKAFKKAIAFILSIAMVATMLTGIVAFADENWQNAYEKSGESPANYEMQVIVNPLASFDAVSIQVGTWDGTVTHKVDIYAWDTNVSTSMAGTKLAYVDIPADNNNGFNSGVVKDASTSANTTLPAGRYLFALSASNGSTAWTIATSGSSNKQVVYGGGSVLNIELRMKLRFTETASDGNYYGVADPDGITVNGYSYDGENNGFDTNSMHIYTKAPSSKMQIKCANYGGQVNHVAKIYKWLGSYALTVAGAPVARYVAEIGGDSGWHTGYFYSATSTNNTIDSTTKINLPAGDYLFVFQAHWNNDKNTMEDTSYLYITGSYGADDPLQDRFTGSTCRSSQLIVKFSFTQEVTTYYGNVKENSAAVAQPYSGDNNGQDDKVYGMHIKTLSTLYSVKAQRFTTSQYYFNIYAWQGSYSASIAGTPLSVSVLPSSTDGGWAEGIVMDATGTYSNPLPAGEYLIVFAGNAGMTSGAYIINKQTSNKYQDVYKAGSSFGGALNVDLTFAKTSSGKYLEQITPDWANAYDGSDVQGYFDTIKIALDLKAKSGNISGFFATWSGTLAHHIDVYAFTGDVTTSMAGTKLAYVDIAAGGDGSWISGNYKDPTTNQNKILDAGKYLFVFSSEKGASYLYATKATSTTKQLAYTSGGYNSSVEYLIKIGFYEEATTYFGTFENTNKTSSGAVAVDFAVDKFGKITIPERYCVDGLKDGDVVTGDIVVKGYIQGAQAELDDNVNFTYMATFAKSVSDVKMVVNFLGKETTIAGVAANPSDDYVNYTFKFTDINACNMADKITITIKSGDTALCSMTDYSIAQYCMDVLATLTDSDTAERGLIVAMLNYGAAAQTYFDNTEVGLANKDLSNTQKGYWSDSEISNATSVLALGGSATSDYQFAAATVALGNVLKIRIKFSAPSLDGLTIKVNGTAYSDFESAAGWYFFYYDGLGADEFAKELTFEIFVNDVTTGQTLKYSVNSYINYIAGLTGSADAAIAKAIYNYGLAAKAYADAKA